MATEDFERLKAAKPDPRRACRVEETPPKLAKMIAAGLDRIIDGADDPMASETPGRRSPA